MNPERQYNNLRAADADSLRDLAGRHLIRLVAKIYDTCMDAGLNEVDASAVAHTVWRVTGNDEGHECPVCFGEHLAMEQEAELWAKREGVDPTAPVAVVTATARTREAELPG